MDKIKVTDGIKPGSGVFMVRTSKEFHTALKVKAHEVGLSMNQLCVRLLKHGIDKVEKA